MLLRDIAEDKIMHGCKRKPVKFKEKKKCLVDVVVCLQPRALYNTELDTENAAGENAVLHLSCFSPFPLETVGLEWADACSYPTFLLSLTTRFTWSSHIPAPASLLPQFRQQLLNLFNNNRGPSPALWP